MLPVNRGRGSVGIGRIVVGIHDLDLVETHEIDPAIAASLRNPAGFGRRSPLDMELAIAEGFLCLNVPGVVELGVAVLHRPGGGLAVTLGPLGQVLAIKKNDRIRGRGTNGGCLGNNLWPGAPQVMNQPLRLVLLRQPLVPIGSLLGRCPRKDQPAGDQPGDQAENNK